MVLSGFASRAATLAGHSLRDELIEEQKRSERPMRALLLLSPWTRRSAAPERVLEGDEACG
jgi:hypothetical protein